MAPITPIDYYDETGWGRTAERPVFPRELKSLDAIRRYGPGRDGAQMLDVGCGDGLFLRLFDRTVAHTWRLHGVDYSQRQLEMAADSPYTFRQCNIEEGIPYDANEFDAVYAGEVIEHVYNPDYLLEECRRVLKPGALLVISTPNLQAWYNRVLFPLGIQPLFYEVSTKSTYIGAGPLRRLKLSDLPVGHLRVFNRRAIVDLMKSEGLEVMNVSGATFHALPRALRRLDRFFSAFPSLASNLIVTARKLS